MYKHKSIALFQKKQIRRRWNKEEEKWYFSIIDVIEVLTESDRPRKYWNDLKRKLKIEGSELSEKIGQLKLKSLDGKKYLTDVANTETLLRLIQSIPSPKAEPFKLWLAQAGYERIEEIEDPELSIERAMRMYLQKGYSKSWINQRLKSIEVRKELTNEWERVGVKIGREFAILTDEITKAWSGKTVKEYKKYKELKKQGLRDNMTNMELILNMLGEASTKEISKAQDPKTFNQSKDTAKVGGEIAGSARHQIESKTGKNIVSKQNAKQLINKHIKSLK